MTSPNLQTIERKAKEGRKEGREKNALVLVCTPITRERGNEPVKYKERRVLGVSMLFQIRLHLLELAYLVSLFAMKRISMDRGKIQTCFLSFTLSGIMIMSEWETLFSKQGGDGGCCSIDRVL